MKRATAAAVAALTLAGAAARAQTADEWRWLERMSEERGERVAVPTARGPRQHAPTAGTAREETRPLRGLWLCQGAEPHHPVRVAPRADADVMGRTMPFVATQGRWVGGFIEILHSNGAYGYVAPEAVLDRDGRLRRFVSVSGGPEQCTVGRVRLNGSPVFDIR